MAKEFIEQKVGSSSLAKAARQQKQLSYFTQSDIQGGITSEYLNAWAERNYKSNDDFLNWVKTVFKTDNFMSFYKFFRSPVASARVINDRVKPQLQRVFFSEDANFKYVINGEEVQTPEELDVKSFDEWIFNALLFRHNDILITDLKDVNTPFRNLVSIDNVVAIESHRSVIHRLAYSATVSIQYEQGHIRQETGFLYMDAQQYIFYNKDLTPLLTIPHDLGECPADYISKEPFDNEDIVRKSMFSYVRTDMEEFVFLKTIQRMTEPNGAIPIVTQLKTKESSKSDEDIKGISDKEPMQSHSIGSQHAEYGKEQTSSKSSLQAGTILKVPMIKKDDGSLDMDAVKNFLNFFYIPTEALEYLNKRINELEQSIVISLLGEMNQNQQRKNELDVRSGFVSAEDKLRVLSMQLSRIRERSDFKFLTLQHGPDRVQNTAFYGSDFFLQSENDLYALFKESPNTIERKNILIKLTKNRNRFNKEKSEREVLLYDLMPYVSDIDFTTAVDNNAVAPETFQYQTRFNYWISVFEAEFGDILAFAQGLETTQSETLVVINNIILAIIKKAIVPIEQPIPET